MKTPSPLLLPSHCPFCLLLVVYSSLDIVILFDQRKRRHHNQKMEEEDVQPLSRDESEKVEQFISCTGVSPDVARQALEACNWNLEMAVNMQFDLSAEQHEEQMETIPPLDVDVPVGAPPPVPPERTGRASSTQGSGRTTSSTATSTTSNNYVSEDGVRAPIPPVRQVLVDDSFEMPIHHTRSLRSFMSSASSSSSGFRDPFRDFRQEALFRESRLAEAEANSLNLQNVDDEGVQASGGASEEEKIRSLEDLFRPPLDLMFNGSLEAAKDQGTRDNKWIMVNIQNPTEFHCQVLNRDIWRNPAVKAIIREHFIFWQMDYRQREAQRYDQFYKVIQYPYVSALDPLTGELLKVWTTAELSDSNHFCESVTDFLQDRPSPRVDGQNPTAPSLMTAISSSSSSKESKELNIADMSEEEQIKAAIEASLQNHANSKCKKEFVLDDDDDDEELETFESFDGDDDESSASVSSSQNNNKLKNIDNKGICTKQEENEDYKKYLGVESEMCELSIRFPDGQKEVVSFPCDTKLKAIFLFMKSKGYSKEKYELVTNFPRRNFFHFSEDDTLKQLGLKRDQLFVQLKT